MHGVFGNSERKVGYACMMPALVASWRKLWAAASSTDALAPFGLVTLAPSGTEGGSDIGTMRWAQTASYGVLPNPAMPNVAPLRLEPRALHPHSIDRRPRPCRGRPSSRRPST